MSENIEEGKPERKRRKNAATILVQIAAELYDLHRTADSRGPSGEIVSEGHVYVTLKDNPSIRRELADIRDDIAAVFEMREGNVPSRTALGDAVTVLKGKARRARRDEDTAGDAAATLLAAHGIIQDPQDAADAYYTGEGCTWWRKPAPGGGIAPAMLATFTAEITEEVTLDDGAEQILTWLVHVTARDGRTGEARISPDQLGKPQQWATRAVGMSALVMPGLATQDHLRVAVQSGSRAVTRRTVYTHSGWREIDGRHAYLTASGALGAARLDESVTVDLGPLSGYSLPAVRDVGDVRDAVRASLAILDVAPDKVTVPVLAAAYRAPLPLAPDCTGWLYGRSGTYKTALTSLAQQHFGPSMDAHGLPGNWTSTANALEAQAFTLDSALFVVDDYSPDASKMDAQRRAAAADRLIRGSANRSGRARLRPDGTQRPEKPPRAQVLTSAEDVPPGVESMRARAFVAEISPGDVNMPKLTAAQASAAAGMLAMATAGYIQWLARRHDAGNALPAELAAERTRLRDAARAEGHPRYALNIGSLALGWHEFLAFAAETGAITTEESEALWSRTWKALVDAGAEQERYARDAEPVRIYLQALAALITQGRAYIADVHGRPPADATRWGWQWDDTREGTFRANGDLIGWVDGDELYLHPEAAYSAAKRFAETTIPLGVSKYEVHTELHRRGLLASITGKGRLTVRKRVGGANPTVLHLTVSGFDNCGGKP